MNKKQRKTSAAVEEPRVGIFWLVGKHLVFDTTPLRQAENYGEFKIHSGDHASIWEKFRLKKTVPAEMEYEEAPRGRVMYDIKKNRFRLLADPCILRRKRLVIEIKKQMHLPKNTITGTDYHYQCFQCLGRIMPD